jgi:hypothetical protein
MQKLLRSSEKISKYLLAAVLVIVVLFPKFPLVKIPGTYVAMRFEDILMLLLAVNTFVCSLGRVKRLLKDKITVAALIFLGSGLLSVIAGSFLMHTTAFSLAIFHWLRRIEYLVPFFAVMITIPKEKITETIEFLIKILMIVTLIALVYGLGQRYFKFPVIITQNEQYSKGAALFWTPGSHINSTFAGHYDLAAFIVLTIPIFITGFFTLKGKISKLMLILSSGAGLWLLINSVSRTAQLSYLSAVVVSLVLVKRFKALLLVAGISLIFMLTSGGLGVRFHRAIEVIYQRITTGRAITYVKSRFVVMADEIAVDLVPTPQPQVSDVSIAIRLNVEWPRAIRAFLKNPLLGTGYSSINLATDNDLLRVLGETGILGLASFLLLFYRIGEVLARALPLPKKFSGIELAFMAGIFGGIIGTFITAVLIDIFEASKFAIIFWLLVGCAVTLVKNKSYE